MSKESLKRLTRDDTEHGVEYYLSDEVDALLAKQPAPVQQEPVAWEISGKLTALRGVQAFVDKHVREVEDSLRQLSNTTPAAQRIKI